MMPTVNQDRQRETQSKINQMFDGAPPYSEGFQLKFSVDWRHWLVGFNWTPKNFWSTNTQFFALHIGPFIVQLTNCDGILGRGGVGR